MKSSQKFQKIHSLFTKAKESEQNFHEKRKGFFCFFSKMQM